MEVLVRLSGMSKSTAETGVGWNVDLLSFQATKEKWSSLKQENKHYARFKEGRSCAVFFELTEILEGCTTTGKHAQSSAQSDVHHSPWSAQKRGVSSAQVKVKEKVDVPSEDFWAEDVYIPIPDDEVELIKVQPGKRKASSVGTSSHDGSRSTKSQKTGDAFRDAATNISKLSQMKIEDKHRRNEWCVAALKFWDKSYSKQEPVELWNRKRLACMKEFDKSERWCQMFLQSDESFQYYYADTILDPKPPQS